MKLVLALLLGGALWHPQRCVTSYLGDVAFYVVERECEYLTCEQIPKGFRCKPVVVNLGPWDPRPAPKDWPTEPYMAPPDAFGTYKTERPADKLHEDVIEP